MDKKLRDMDRKEALKKGFEAGVHDAHHHAESDLYFENRGYNYAYEACKKCADETFFNPKSKLYNQDFGEGYIEGALSTLF